MIRIHKLIRGYPFWPSAVALARPQTEHQEVVRFSRKIETTRYRDAVKEVGGVA